MWYRSWIETRWRVVLMLIVNGFIGSVLIDDAAGAAAWRQRLNSVLPMIFAMNAIVLAGSGVASQISNKPGQTVHTSMLFLLSLPVTRRRLVLVRQAVGALAAVAVVLATLSAFVVASPELRAIITPGFAAAYVSSVLLVVLTAYAVSALLATVLDQLWQTYAAMAVVGGVLGGIPLTRVWRVVLEDGAFGASSTSSGLAGMQPWSSIALAGIVCVAVSAVLVMSAVKIVNNKEF